MQEQLSKMIMIDKISKTKISVQLKDKDDNEVSIQETIEKLSEWVKNNVTSEEENSCQKQIFPLMSQAVLFSVNKIVGSDYVSAFLGQQATRNTLIYMMTIGFYFLKWMQKNEVKVFTSEEPIADEEINSLNRINNICSVISSLSVLGYNAKPVIKLLLDMGEITKEDLVKLGCEDWIEDDAKKDEEN